MGGHLKKAKKYASKQKRTTALCVILGIAVVAAAAAILVLGVLG